MTQPVSVAVSTGRPMQSQGGAREMMYSDMSTEQMSKALNEQMRSIKPDVRERPIGEYFRELLEHKSLKKTEVMRRAGLDKKSYGYQILRGARRGSRDTYIKLALVMNLSLDETQHMLFFARVGVLYLRNERDLILKFCIENGIDVDTAQEYLLGHGCEPLP